MTPLALAREWARGPGNQGWDSTWVASLLGRADQEPALLSGWKECVGTVQPLYYNRIKKVAFAKVGLQNRCNLTTEVERTRWNQKVIGVSGGGLMKWMEGLKSRREESKA